MGIVNVTPDSFSDGGRWFDPREAVAHGIGLMEQGADLLDVGGESTRPGAVRISAAEELRRVLPVIRELSASGVTVGIDTMRADVAARAVDAGARLVNDVSGGLMDRRMLPLIARSSVPYVINHWRNHGNGPLFTPARGDIVSEVIGDLRDRTDAALAAGIPLGRLIVDPGIGFGKAVDDNWPLLGRLREFASLGCPIMVGASRKAFLGKLLADPVTRRDRPTDAREAATTAVTVLAAAQGTWCVRVHDVASTADALRVTARWGREALTLAF
ncbi:dihydropteroate synthase [Streptomyces sp. NPDC054887]